MAGLVPAIHDLNTTVQGKSWMPGTSPGMTGRRWCGPSVVPGMPLGSYGVAIIARPASLARPCFHISRAMKSGHAR
jgi:hypothetical protein